MRKLISLFAVSLALAFPACSAGTDALEGDDVSVEEESSQALSAYGNKLVGAYKLVSGASEFTWVVFKADGSYFTESQIVCVRAPCVNPRTEGYFRAYSPAKGKSYGTLKLYPEGERGYDQYRVSIGVANESWKLSADRGATWGKFETVNTFCREASDCDGQSYPHIMCVGHATCTSDNTCGYQCGSPQTCNYEDPSKRYVGKSRDICSRIRYTCDFAAGESYFADDCGCGCAVPAPASDCKVTGCSGQICADQDMITTCEFRPEYACYASASCARDASTGACGWVKTAELSACLSANQ